MNTHTYPTEAERRKVAAHKLLEARRALHVLRGRRALLGKLLADGTATADDVRAAVELPPDIDPKCLGAVPGALARAGIIRRVGFASTNRAAAHARPVSVWQLADRTAALTWLAEHPDRPDPSPDDDADDEPYLTFPDSPETESPTVTAAGLR